MHDPTREPPARFVLQTLGGDIDVVAGEAFELTDSQVTLRATLRPVETRRLDVGELSFCYPTHMIFSCDTEDAPDHVWSLEGSDMTLKLWRVSYDVPDLAAEAKEVAGLTQAEFAGPTEQSAAEPLRLGEDRVAGTRLRIEFENSITVLQDYYCIRANGTVFILMLQESPDDPATPTAEMRRVRELLAGSWSVAAADGDAGGP